MKKLSSLQLLTILSGLNFFNLVDRYVLSSVVGLIQNDLHLNDTQMGRLATAFMLGFFITSPLFGWLGDRFPRKFTIAFGIFIWSLATCLTGTAKSYEELLFYRVLVGIGEASYMAISPSLISDVFPKRTRNRAMTWFSAAVPVGAAVGFAVGGIVGTHYGWRNAFLFSGAPGLLLAFILIPFKDPKRGESDSQQTADSLSLASPPSEKALSAVDLFRIPNYLLTVAGYAMWTFAIGAFGYWGPTFLTRTHGMNTESASLFFGAVLVVSGLFGTVIGGELATRLLKRTNAAYAFLLAIPTLIATPICFVAIGSSSKTFCMAGLAVGIFLLFFTNGPVNTLVVETVPAHSRSLAMAGAIFCIHLFGDLWSPEMVGRAADRFGSLSYGLQILPVTLLLASIFWFILSARMVRNSNEKI